MGSLCNVASLFTSWALLETVGGMWTLAEANRWFWNWITFTWLHQSCADHPIITKHLPSCYYIDPLWWCGVRCRPTLIQAPFRTCNDFVLTCQVFRSSSHVVWEHVMLCQIYAMDPVQGKYQESWTKHVKRSGRHDDHVVTFKYTSQKYYTHKWSITLMA